MMEENGTDTHKEELAPRPAGTHRPVERRAQASTAGPVCWRTGSNSPGRVLATLCCL